MFVNIAHNVVTRNHTLVYVNALVFNLVCGLAHHGWLYEFYTGVFKAATALSVCMLFSTLLKFYSTMCNDVHAITIDLT